MNNYTNLWVKTAPEVQNMGNKQKQNPFFSPSGA
jgi:hypothetical protein